jgi:hypothetical protein
MRQFLPLILAFIFNGCIDDNRVGQQVPPEQLLSNVIHDSIIGNDEIPSTSYPFDTTLAQGYHLNFRITIDTTENDSIQRLFLMKNDDEIIELSSTSYGIPHKSLGFLWADFENSFVFVQTFGGGNPRTVQLIEKKTGKNLIEEFSVLIDVDETSQMMLYSENDTPNPSDRMTLYDVKKNVKKQYEFPSDVFGCNEVCNNIDLLSVTNASFIIEYGTCNEQKVKQRKYSR